MILGGHCPGNDQKVYIGAQRVGTIGGSSVEDQSTEGQKCRSLGLIRARCGFGGGVVAMCVAHLRSAGSVGEVHPAIRLISNASRVWLAELVV